MPKKNWFEFLTLIKTQMGELGEGAPQTMGSFRNLSQRATREGELDSKTKELIALAIGIAVRCDGCLAFHAKAAADEGATRQEVIETISVAVYMGGGPSVFYGAEALEAFDAFAP